MLDFLLDLLAGIPFEKGELPYHLYANGLADNFSKVTSLIYSFLSKYRLFVTDSERIQFILHHKEVQLLIGKLVAQFHSATLEDQKNDVMSAQYRANGNESFEEKRYDHCLHWASRSIRYASSEIELACCYAARSVVYFCLEAYESSLLDVEAALKLSTQPDISLLILKCECLLHLDQGEEAKLVFDEARAAVNSQKVDSGVAHKLAMLADKIQKIPAKKSNKVTKTFSMTERLVESGRYQPQSGNRFLSKKVEIRYSKKHGRHLVATEDLAFGDIVGVTQPYAAVLTTKTELRFCHHCLAELDIDLELKYFPRSVPCSGCTRIAYCSEQCREKSWTSYHRFECPLQLPLSSESTEDGSYFHLAFRTLLTAGGVERVHEAIQKFTQNGKEAEAMKSVDFTDNPMDYYENIYRMRVQSRTYPPKGIRKQARYQAEDQICRIIVCAFMTKIAKLDSDFATNLELSQKEYSIVGILLRHTEQVRHNEAIFLPPYHHPAGKIHFGHIHPVNTLDPLIGLVLPSCEPNLTITTLTSDSDTNSSSNISVLFSLKPIRAGTILTSFVTHYGDSSVVRFCTRKQMEINVESFGFPGETCYCTYCKDNRLVTTYRNMDDIAVYMFTGEVRCTGDGCGGVIRSTERLISSKDEHKDILQLYSETGSYDEEEEYYRWMADFEQTDLFQAMYEDERKRRLKPPEANSKSQCLTCERVFPRDEVLKLKKGYTDIFKLHYDAYSKDRAIDHKARWSVPYLSNYQRRRDPPRDKVPLSAEELDQVLSMLDQLEAMITEQLAPLVHGHCPLLLVEHYKQLAKQYSKIWVESQQIGHLRTGWKYAEAAHQTMVLAFGGDSAKLVLLMQETISIFESAIELLKNSLTQLKNQMESMVIRNIKVEVINHYYKAKGKLVKLEQKYQV